jgi:ATP-dependent helicase/DNAse subunit B
MDKKTLLAVFQQKMSVDETVFESAKRTDDYSRCIEQKSKLEVWHSVIDIMERAIKED